MKQADALETPAPTSKVINLYQQKEQQGIDNKQAAQLTVSTQKQNDTQKTPSPKVLKQTKSNLISDCIEVFTVQGVSIFKLNPQLQQHQAIGYKVPSFEVKVRLDFIKEQRYLWDTFVGYAKRELFLHDGFIYSLEKNNTGHFVNSIWRLDNLFRVYYDREDSRFRLVFKEEKTIKNRDFWTKLYEPFMLRLKEELSKMGRTLV